MPSKAKELPITFNQIQGERYKRSLKWFVRGFWKVLEPANPFVDDYHIDAICDHLQHIFEIKRLLINVPPRHSKSLLCSIFFPAWLWLTDPSIQFLCCSHSLKLSEDFSLRCRRLIQADMYQGFYGSIYQLERDENKTYKFANSAAGFRQAVSVDSGVTGQSSDITIIDDPNDIGKAASKAEREKVITFYREVLSTRTNYKPNKTARIIIQQRCHGEDLSGYILENDMGEWTKVILPYEYDPDRHCRTTYFNDPRKRPGQILSTRIPPDEIEDFKRKNTKATYEAQYNQNPRPDDGMYFKRDNFRYFVQDGEFYYLQDRKYRKADCWRFISTDLAISLKTSADWSVFAVVDITPDGDLIVSHLKRDKMDASGLVATFKTMNQIYKPAYFLVETVGFQEFAIQQIRQEGVAIRSMRPNTDKVTRSIPLQIKCESHQLWLPEDATWLRTIEDELLTFPNAKHDDVVDALAWSAQEASKRFRKPKEEEKPVTDPEEIKNQIAKAYNAALMEGIF